MLASKIVGEKGLVFAIEPTEYGFSHLIENIGLNDYDIKAYKIAFGVKNRKNVNIS